MLALLLALGSASAATNEIDLEAGWFGSSDAGWDLFSEADLYGTWGFRLGYAVHPRIAIIGGAQFGKTGQTVESYSTEDRSTFYTGFYGDTFTLGAKGDVQVASWLHPYVTVQGVGLRGLARFDDDRAHDDNASQVQVAGFTGGVLGTVGLDFPIALGHSGFAVSPYTEFGYGWTAPLALGDVGSVQLSGFTGRAGVGLRF